MAPFVGLEKGVPWTIEEIGEILVIIIVTVARKRFA
jgi:hypothetical protein